MNSGLPRRSALPLHVALAIAAPWCGAHAQATPAESAWRAGVAALGATGGLVIPSADTLGNGELVLSHGSYSDPRFGTYGSHPDFLLGIGIWQGLELFGRYAVVAPAGGPEVPGFNRDISANFKWQLPTLGANLPKVAIGGTDLAGGSRWFGSYYAVASDRLGPVRWSVGASKNPSRTWRVFGGAFGGIDVDLFGSGVSALAESDGIQRHVGFRYSTPGLPWLGDGRLQATVQRPVGAVDWKGISTNRSAVAIALRIPMGKTEAARMAAAPSRPIGAMAAEPVVPGKPEASQSEPTRAAFSPTGLASALRSAGLESVRVGRRADELVVAYENRAFLTDEVDALGIVFGLASRAGAPGASRVRAVALKSGLPVSNVSVDAAGFLAFLDDAHADRVRQGLRADTGDSGALEGIDWLTESAVDAHPLRIELKPLLNYRLATEWAPFDYSLAANLRASTSLWRGGLLYADRVARVSNSAQMEPGQVFGDSRHRSGFSNVAVQQSMWLHPSLFASVGAGRYRYDYVGVEGQAIWLVPGRDDTVHFKGQALSGRSSATVGHNTQAAGATYRWAARSDTWLEGGVQRYSDGTSGPSVGLTRWFDDISLNLLARAGGRRAFVGFEFGIPLTSRKALDAGPVRFGGTPRFVLSYRMRLVANSLGALDEAAVRPVDLAFRPEIELLNSGRTSLDHYGNRLQRMREAFFAFGQSPMGGSATEGR